MKKLLSCLFVASSLVGCATSFPVGVLYTGGNLSQGISGNAVTVDANSRVSAAKRGIACASSVLGLVAWGDNSVQTAKKNGMISRVATIDYNVDNVLGAYGKYCTVVTGE